MTDTDDRNAADFNVRSKILGAIDATDDPKQRNMLLLLFGVLEVTERGLTRIEKKIDAVMRDEATIKRIALNGHLDSHDDDHDWIKQQRDLDCHSICTWAREKMAAEKETERNRKSAVQKFFEGMAAQAGTIIATAILTGIGAMLVMGAK